ncbi:hypothetical protein FCULG_00008223 [Fusarium culmorum]|uniref:Uncharacterized protein n=1 Tax=Fusarium culmorum TaxID=5516 RepID=A0A2T4H3R9_FUSCU|nr:hypothetical protein FCULG_00008223 [Fusarium culmorum]
MAPANDANNRATKAAGSDSGMPIWPKHGNAEFALLPNMGMVTKHLTTHPERIVLGLHPPPQQLNAVQYDN